MAAKGNPGYTDAAREKRLISLAMDNAEERLANGTAGPSIIVHFLKLGSEMAKLASEKVRQETRLLEAKKQSIESSEKSAEFYEKVMEAIKMYNKSSDDDGDEY